MRLGILTSHPIQYQAPWFRELASAVDLEVFFAHRQSAAEQAQTGFGVAFDWDVDLLSGYSHRFVENISKEPGVDHFSGCDTPDIFEIISGRVGPKQFDAFIVCGWYLRSYLQATAACRSARIPVLVRGDSQLRTPRTILRRLAMEVRQRWLLRRFDGFLTVGQRNGEYLKHFGVSDSKLFFVPHFVDNDWFAERAAEARGQRFMTREKWGAGDADCVALFVGKFIAEKRPLDLLYALRKLKKECPRIMAVFVGAGALLEELKSVSERENLRVHFAGFKNQTELPACYAGADILVLPSDSETWGLVVNEAMACGLPAIVSDAVGCAPDLIEEGKTGFVFPPGNFTSLAECLLRFVEMKDSGDDFKSALLGKMQTYSLPTAVANTLSAVKELAIQKHG
jgi:glycosyltransferase involved in cell wall biosynthesis